jgi:hypothetical protein
MAIKAMRKVITALGIAKLLSASLARLATAMRDFMDMQMDVGARLFKPSELTSAYSRAMTARLHDLPINL